MAHMRQSRPDSGLGFHVKVLKVFNVIPSSLGSLEVFRFAKVNSHTNPSTYVLYRRICARIGSSTIRQLILYIDGFMRELVCEKTTV